MRGGVFEDYWKCDCHLYALEIFEIDLPAMDRKIVMKTHMAEAFMLPYNLLSGTLRRGDGYGSDSAIQPHFM